MKKTKFLFCLLISLLSFTIFSCSKENIYKVEDMHKDLLLLNIFDYSFNYSSVKENINLNTIYDAYKKNKEIAEGTFDKNYEILAGYLTKNYNGYKKLIGSEKYIPGGNNSDLFNSLYSYEIQPNEITLYSFNNCNPTIEYNNEILLFVMYRIGYTINNERKYLCIDITDEFFENDLKYDNSYDSYINNKLITPVTYLPSIITFSNEETLLKHFIRVYKENGKEYIKTSNLNSSSYEKFKDAIVNENNSTGELTLNFKIIKKILEI